MEKVARFAGSGLIVSLSFIVLILIILCVYIKCSKNNSKKSHEKIYKREISNNPTVKNLQKILSNNNLISANNVKNSVNIRNETTEEEEPLK